MDTRFGAYELETDFNGKTFTDEVLVHVVQLQWNSSGGATGDGGGATEPVYTTAAAAPPQEYDDSPGAPGQEGGFGGPPQGSGFDILQEPFRLDNVEFTTVDQNGATVNAIQLDVTGTTCDHSESHTLLEDPAHPGIFADANDDFAMRIINHQPGAMSEADDFEFFVSSVAFGRAGFGKCRKDPQETFQTRHVEIAMDGPREPQPDAVDSFILSVTSNDADDTFTVSVASNDGDDGGTLTETGPDTNVYTNPDGSLTLEIVRQHIDPQTERLDRTVRITSTALDIANRSVDAIEATPNTGQLQTAAIQSNANATPGTGAATGYIPIGQVWTPTWVDSGAIMNPVPVKLDLWHTNETRSTYNPPSLGLYVAGPVLSPSSPFKGVYLDPAGFDQVHVMPVDSLPGPSLWQTTPYPLGGAGSVLVSVLANPGEELRITSEKDRPDDDANDPKTPFCNMTLLRLDIDLEGITDSDEESLGGVVVRHHDGNGAPRKQLLIHKVAPNAAWNGNVTLHCSDTSKVTLFDAANGGAEVLFNGIDNTFANSTIPEEGKSLYVQGDTGSLSMRDVEFKLTTSDTGSFSDRVCLSVVWVNISPDHTAEVDTDNALRSQFVTRRMAPTPFLGDANIIPDWETVLKARTSEFIGAVWPSDFDINSHPVSFDFRQDVLSARFYLEYGSSRYIVRAEDNISDNPEGWVDLDPAPYGNIYFLDSPGMEQTLRLENGAPAPHGTVMRMRGNFECWATISDGSNGIETRCSTKLQWYTRSSHELTGETEVDSATIFTSDTIGVLSASWTSDKWFPGAVTVHEGTGAKQSRRVTGNTTGTINITPSWDTLLNFDSIFQVINWSTWTKINDITNDNKSGNGSTSITWDLN